MKKMLVTSLDKDGNVVDHQETKEEWCLSELEFILMDMKIQMYKGKVQHILIDAVN